MKMLGHDVTAKRLKDGQLHAYIDGKLDRSIPPSPYRGVLYRRVMRLKRDQFKNERPETLKAS